MFAPLQKVYDKTCQNIVVFITITLRNLNFVTDFCFLVKDIFRMNNLLTTLRKNNFE
jgi:hypothetical protein